METKLTILSNGTPFFFHKHLGSAWGRVRVGVGYETIFDKILWKRGLVGNKFAQPSISVKDFC